MQALPDNIGDSKITTTEDEDGTTFTLRVEKVHYKCRGKYSCTADGVSTAGYLDFDGKTLIFQLSTYKSNQNHWKAFLGSITGVSQRENCLELRLSNEILCILIAQVVAKMPEVKFWALRS